MKTEGDAPRGFASDEEVLEVVRRFETCEFSPDEFNHREHLCVALVYARRLEEREALERTRAGIHDFLTHHRITPASVYHETITVFWLRRVRAFAEADGRASLPLAALAEELFAVCGNSRLIYDYYTKARLDTDEAREVLVEPDLKPFDF
ncbi:MAG TPA: hypothetical protein VFX96_11135 [Pyrinomonadaceae bacterium]|nr:hypothetical protein [Pyrinomonadaceae bacterium]